MHGPGSPNALNTLNVKLKKLKLQQLDCAYSEAAMAPFRATRDGLSTYLRDLFTDVEVATEAAIQERVLPFLDDLLILPLSVALCEQSANDAETRYIPLDMAHLIPVLQLYAPDVVLPCVVHQGLSLQQIREEQSRRSMLHSGYYRQKTSGFLKQLKACRPDVFEAKQLTTLFNVSESGLYKDKSPAKKTKDSRTVKPSNAAPTYDSLDDLIDISEF